MADADPIQRLNAALEGRYRVERELGAGGMATVYLAEDLRHHRSVALKVLKPQLAAVVGADRFLAEIETTASLQHPHILPLFDSGEADGFLFYVMPHVAGESLRARLDREHRLPVDDAVDIVVKLAGALDYAHRHGVIHRDIKPANILLHEGEPVVADFGIALAVSAGGGDRLTETGLSLGTPHYMSPEQATGETHVGPPTDVWALGCVLYEMLAGEPPFTGSTPQAVLGKIVLGELGPLTAQRRTVPPNVEAAVAKALERVPADRFGSSAGFAAALRDPAFKRRLGRRGAGAISANKWPWVGLGLFVAGVFLYLASATPSNEGSSAHLNVVVPDSIPVEFVGEASLGVGQTALALAPDGRSLAYVGSSGETTRLYVRTLGDPGVRGIAGSEGAYAPFFSPDGSYIGFFAGSRLFRVSADGTNLQPLHEVDDPLGASWSEDGRIAVVVHDGGGLLLIPSGGGPSTAFDRAGPPSIAHPHWLPGGEQILLTCYEPKRICVSTPQGDLRALAVEGLPRDVSTARGLLEGSNPVYVEPGFLLYGAPFRNALMAVRFDAETLEVRGEPRVLLEGVRRESARGVLQTAISGTGDLLFARGANAELGRFVWVGPDGVLDSLRIPSRLYGRFSISPDRRYVAATVFPDVGGAELRLIDLDQGGPGRRWSMPEGVSDQRVSFGSWLEDSARFLVLTSGDTIRIFEADRRQPRRAELLWEGTEELYPWSRTPDGRFVLAIPGRDGAWIPALVAPDALASLPPRPSEALAPLPAPRFHPLYDVSPDGRWLAYISDEEGPYHVYAIRLDRADPRVVPVSAGPGEVPRWSPRGDGLYYRNATRFYWVPYTGREEAPFGEPELFIEGNYLNVAGPEMEVSQDGRRLLLLKSEGRSSRTTLDLILNVRDRLEDLFEASRE